MKLIIDTHTHTVASGHAYSTLQEMAKEASNKGLKAFSMTDHGSSLLGAPCKFHFTNLRVVPNEIYGIRIFKGIEANIIDYLGTLDMPDKILKNLDFVLASLHDVCIDPANIDDHTNALIKALENPYVDAIAHPGNPTFPVDIEKVVKACKDNGKCIEINNHSNLVRRGSENNCIEFANKCKKFNVNIVCGSDAHISFDVGAFANVYKILESANISEELVLSTSIEKFENFLEKKKERLARF